MKAEKRILILSSNNTGHGHKSITESLCTEFSKYPEIETFVIDGFTFGGNLGIRIGKLYGTVTRNAKDLYKMVWDMSFKNPELTVDFTENMIIAEFLKTLKKIKPDMIIATHPNFNGAVLNILEKYKLNIPLFAVVADIVSISPLWADARAYTTICPSEEARRKCIEFGVPDEKIVVTGFPVRQQFCSLFEKGIQKPDFDFSRPLECLVMSGGEGSGNMTAISRILLKNYNSKIKILTGRNKRLKTRLEKTLMVEYPGRVSIYGFVENVQDLLITSDIVFTRGSPNSMMEAIMCNVPLVITGSLPGQEEGNPGFAESRNLGVVCGNVKKLKETIDGLLTDNCRKLKEIRASQKSYASPDAASRIVDLVMAVKPCGDIPFDTIDSALKRSDIKKFLPAISTQLGTADIKQLFEKFEKNLQGKKGMSKRKKPFSEG